MFREVRRMGLWAAVLVAAGCATPEDEPKVKSNMELAKIYYNSGKFDQSKDRYMAVLEQVPDHYLAIIGLGNTCREYGNELYSGVMDLIQQRKIDAANKMLGQANENHMLAAKCFVKAVEMKSSDGLPHYGRGQLYYQRATSPVPYPLKLDDKAARQGERDRAIEDFRLCLKKAPQLYQAHRYLGLALFAADETTDGREHLKIYHDAMQQLYEHVFNRWPTGTEDEKKNRDEALRSVERDILDVRDILIAHRDEMERRRNKLVLKSKASQISSDEQQDLARCSREILEVDKTLGEFQLTKLGPVESKLRERCQHYLRSINRAQAREGSYQECLEFVDSRPEQAAAARQSLTQKLQMGIRYENVRYKAITVSPDGSDGTVGIVCDITSNKGPKPGSEVTIHWKIISGQWLVSEHP